MLTTKNELPPVGYSIAEFEKLTNTARRVGYRLIKEGKIVPFVTITGSMRISQNELYRYLAEKEAA